MSPCLDDTTLHALLDRALPAQTAATCERHLALCAACRQRRDAAAHMRDAVTALLAGSGAPRRAAPAFASLVAQAAARRSDGAELPLVVGLPQPDTRSAATAPARRVRTVAPHDGARSAPLGRRRIGRGLLVPSAIGLAAAIAGFGVQSWRNVTERDAARLAGVVAAATPAVRSPGVDAAQREVAERRDIATTARTGAARSGAPAVSRPPAAAPHIGTDVPVTVEAPDVAVTEAARRDREAVVLPQDTGRDEPEAVLSVAAPVATVRIEVLDGAAPLRTVATDPATPTVLAVPVSSASRLAAEEVEGRTARPVRTSPTFGAARSVPHPYVSVGSP